MFGGRCWCLYDNFVVVVWEGSCREALMVGIGSHS